MVTTKVFMESPRPFKGDGRLEVVLFVFDFFDQPRSGIANYLGDPHRFGCPFDDEIDGYSEFYLLAPISFAELQLEREAWDIYYGHGPTPELPSVLSSPIPRLPEAEARYEEIQTLLGESRKITEHAAIRATAELTVRENVPLGWSGRRLWEVRWRADQGKA